MFAPAPENQFAEDVRAGLTRAPQKTLPCRYFYDDVGSALFEAITCLQEYGLTRADARVLCANSGKLAARMPDEVLVAELGSGSGSKTRHILEHLGGKAGAYYPIDVSASSLVRCAQELGQFTEVLPLESNYLDGLRAVEGRRCPGQRLLVLFLGSTIGNFEPEEAVDFLYSIRQCLHPGDFLLLGTDLVKAEDVMIRAYDDPVGVTAAFNLNLLARINRELEADFDLRQFEHIARYNRDAQRIEMHLRSRRVQTVRIQKARLTVDFQAGETIQTESCHKFVTKQLADMARATAFHVEASWVDAEWPFAESLWKAV